MKLLSKKAIMIIVVMVILTTIVFSNQMVIKKKPPVLKTFIKVELTSTAKYFMGICPVTVKMKGTISVSEAITLEYYFVRSDGAKSNSIPLIFRRAGKKDVHFSWTIGGDYQGWVQLVANSKGSLKKSNKVGFQVKCDKKKVPILAMKKFDLSKIRVKKPELIFIQKNTTRIINKLSKHLPRTLNICKLAKWIMKSPQPSGDPNTGVVSSIWKTTYDGMDIQVTSSVSPGYEGMIISGIKLTISANTGYNRNQVSGWITKKYGTNTMVGSTAYSIEYMTNCWFFFKLYPKKVIVELKWKG